MQITSLHFYLLPSEKVFFEKIENIEYLVTNQEVQKDSSPEGIFNALKYRYSLKYLGKSYEELFVLCIPAQEHHIQTNDKCKKSFNNFPTFIKTYK